jgi:SAM-dependent methyltransferase
MAPEAEGKSASPFAYESETYGEKIADVYDAWYGVRLQKPEAAVQFLAAFAGKGRALELGIGTGRIAIPLAASGVRIAGIDASPAMVTKLRDKPGGDAIPVTIGDFASVPVRGSFALIYVVFNTFFALLTQEDQVRCFARVAKRLRRDGVFVIEAFPPDLSRFDRGQRTSATHLDTQSVYLDVVLNDPVAQSVRVQHVVLTEGGVRLYPVQLRYAYPSELDLMARLAGMRLRERWGGWNREAFTAASQIHVSVYELASAASPRR